MSERFMEEYRRWAESPALSAAERAELAAIAGNETEIENRFYAPMSFGTAGLRGIMGMGISRMNVYLIRQATWALGQLIVREGEAAMARGCVICYDCRRNSRAFAEAAAEVMAGSGIHVRLFRELRPTPELSFAIRHTGAVAGINITASHNTKEYNGYKVYWEDGAQLPPEHAAQVSAVMAGTDILAQPPLKSLQEAEAEGLLSWLGEEIDELFMAQVLEQCIEPEEVAAAADALKIVYTPFHGAGRVIVPEVLRRLGVTQLYCVEEQMVPDGDFPTVASPNPENPEGFALSVELADRVGANLIIGTDPDSDRIGVLVRDREGAFRQISGNRMGVLLIDYILAARKRKGCLPENAAVIKTIVTTDMARVAAEQGGAACFDTFTGFKYMAEKIKGFERDGSYKAVFSYEESYGCMIGDFVRDKDAVSASAMMAEMAAWYAGQGKSLLDAMEELLDRCGCFDERSLSFVMPGADGVEKRGALMTSLRAEPPREVGGIPVTAVRDYADGTETELTSGLRSEMELKGSDVLIYLLADGSKLAVRPSGTEPKIKMYVLVRGESREDCARKAEACAETARQLARRAD